MPLKLRLPAHSRPPSPTSAHPEPAPGALVLPPSPLHYHGWLRTSADGKRWSPWVRVCDAPTYWDTWEVLLGFVAGAAHVERAVVVAWEEP